jgi:dUTP pyrophosphatase
MLKVNNMNFNLEYMQQRILEVADPNNPYSQKDFDYEFNNFVSTNNVDQDYWKTKMFFVNKSKNQDPEYATEGSSGFDLRADLTEPITIKPSKRAIIPTGLFFQIPDNFEIQIRPRSGLAAKNGVTVLNTPGTIDADYRGEIKIILINLGEEDFVVNNGDRIAQAVIATTSAKNIISLLKTNEISDDTERGSGGFGSTGLL